MNSLSKTVTRQRRDYDLNSGPSASESSTLTTTIHKYDINTSHRLTDAILKDP